LALGCAHRQIPGTTIDDNSDTRAILGVMERYRNAVETKDVKAIVGLVDKSFKDDGGSTTPDDDLDFETLQKKLTARFLKLDNIRLDIEVRSIMIKENAALAVYFYTTRFDLPGLAQKPLADSDVKQMSFKLVASQWKIVSGI